MIAAGGNGSRLSLRSAGTTIAWPARSTNLRLWEKIAGPDPLFRIVINNGWHNQNA
jgi:hypothetical protein